MSVNGHGEDDQDTYKHMTMNNTIYIYVDAFLYKVQSEQNIRQNIKEKHRMREMEIVEMVITK